MQAIEVIDHILHIGRILHIDQVVLLIRVVPVGLLRHRPPITPHLLLVRLQERQIQNRQVVNRQVVNRLEIVTRPHPLKGQHPQRLSARNSIWEIESSKKE